jgi:hypothetical protein
LRARADASQATVTLTVGATLAEARRQMLLRTFSSTGGDVERTAHTLGISEGEVRSELGSLLGAQGKIESNGATKPAAKAVGVKEKGTERAKGKAKGRR